MKLRELDKTAKFVAPLLLSGEPNSLASIACLNRFVELLACAPENCAEVVARLHHLSASQLTRAKEMIVEGAHLVTGIAAEAGAFRSVALEAEAASVRTRLAAGASWFKRWTRACARSRAPGRYILAVECDGAAYHGALWARERDRLRQEILESQGWRFHRIWSTDWFYRRSDEIKRLNAVLEGVRGEADRPRRPIA